VGIGQSAGKETLNIKNTELAWLAGFTDADGSISLFRHHRKGDNWKIYPVVVFTNTNPAHIQRILTILDSLGLSMHIRERIQENEKWANSYQLTSKSHPSIMVLLEAIEPYLAGKKPQAQLVLRYLHSRRSRGLRSTYNADEQSYCDQVLLLNKRGVSKILTDYTQDTPKGEDIVGAVAKSTELSRND
jgi:hypothetical protein